MRLFTSASAAFRSCSQQSESLFPTLHAKSGVRRPPLRKGLELDPFVRKSVFETLVLPW